VLFLKLFVPAIFLALLCTLPAAAQTGGGEDVYKIGNGVTAPRVTHQVAPDHPSEGFRVAGTVLIGLIVSSKGEPTDIHVVHSLEKELDRAAMDAVKQWRFDPAIKDGKPVAVRLNIEIRFHDM